MLWRWLSRTIEWKTLFSMALLLFALGSVAYGLSDIIRGVDFTFLLLIMLLGMLVGWGAAALPMSGWLAAALGLFVGLEVVLLRVGRLGGQVFKVLQALGRLVWEIGRFLGQVLQEQEDIIAPGWMAFLSTLWELWQSILVLLGRAGAWLLSLPAEQTVFDPVSTALVWGFAAWLVALWAGWTVSRRSKPLAALLPAGALLANALSYTWASSTTLLSFLSATLILMAVCQHNARENRWVRVGIDFSRDLWVDLLVAASIISVVLMGAASIAPSLSIQKLIEFVEGLVESRETDTERIAQSLGLEQQPASPREVSTFEELRVTSLPRRHLIGSGPELSEQVVMIIRTGELPPALDATLLPYPPPVYYWQSLIYDRYEGRGWVTSRADLVDYGPGQAASPLEVPYHRPLRQDVRFVEDMGGILHVVGTLVAVDQEYTVAWRGPNDPFGGTVGGRGPVERYRADSLIPVATEEDLRNAEADYPFWLQRRYLQLPEVMTDRVLSLARDLTATEPTPYDRALAIEAYLRTFPYTLDVPYPPYNQEMVDYFLFDLQKGYCDYYATAMVVLARAAGLPARMVIGYLGSNYDVGEARYVISEADAHAWPEIYFPGYGWIPFEPTSGRPPLERALELDDLAWLGPDETAFEPLVPADSSRGLNLWPWLLGIVGAVGALLARTGIDALALRLRLPAATVAALYRRLWRHARRLGVKTCDGDTPYEFIEAFERRLEEIKEDRPGEAALLQPAHQEARFLIELYVRQQYTPMPVERAGQGLAIATWWRLRWRLWLAWLLRKSRRERLAALTAERSGDRSQRQTLPPL